MEGVERGLDGIRCAVGGWRLHRSTPLTLKAKFTFLSQLLDQMLRLCFPAAVAQDRSRPLQPTDRY